MQTSKALVVFVMALAILACGRDPADGESALRVTFGLSAVPGVAAVRYEVARVDCSSGAVLDLDVSADAGFHDFPLPPLPAAPAVSEESQHQFADAFLVLTPGCYDVRATPLDAAHAPSLLCAPAEQKSVIVLPGITTEISLFSQCGGRHLGALDAVAILNRAPQIVSLAVEPSPLIPCGEAARICATATDADGDPLEFAWSAAPSNPGEAVPLVAERTLAGDSVTECVEIAPRVSGRYALELSVYDLAFFGPDLLRLEDALATQAEPLLSHPPAPSLRATLRYTSTSSSGYCAEVAVLNAGTAPVATWTVTLELVDARLLASSVHDAEFTSAGSLFLARPPGAGSALSAGASTTFGFCAQRAGSSPSASVVTVH
jgi:hypothetical protein